ncbi:ProQ/FINO family protein [Marinomonas ostreistagni]|uniref:ProQ/FINO family protein n=1 Tax=Marinomonas ostreistagni TaxID=359209 RepID=UPI00194FC133|nr:ProQ/FINO family protein [Marinomonas ostreistagni]MBM6552170.1 ProQ/FinO family protein [Marinomonas ostreistagni]
MDRLIQALEEQVDRLMQQLKDAHQEIERLKSTQASPSSSPSDATLDLLSSMSKHSTEEQLQLYIEDSLDLLSPPANTQAHDDLEQQLNFDLLHHEVDPQPTEDNEKTKESPMTTEQNPTSTAEHQETAAATDVEQTQASAPTSDTPEKPALSAEEKRRQKNQKNNRRLIRLLEERYPKAFDWNNPRPLKVGIDKDMVLDEEFNASKQKRAMAAYVRSDRYKKCLQSGQPRIDLEGNPVSDEPALPNTQKPAETKKPAPKSKPKQARPQGGAQGKGKPKSGNRPNNKPKAQPKEDAQFENMSQEERMQAKLSQLLNKK